MDTRAKRILVVEDVHERIQRIADILAKHGFCVEVVHTQPECLTMLVENRPAAIVMDLATPLVDGWQMVTELRADEICGQTPVIAVTAYHSANVAEDARHAGFDAYYPKPVEPATFVRGIRTLIEASG